VQPMPHAGTGTNSYESGLLSRATGGPLRPGGMDLTERMLALIDLPVNALILDLGCGTGSTVSSLLRAGFRAVGLDRSELLLQTGKMSTPALSLSCGWSKSLPLASGQVDAIMAECSLSAMSDLDATLAECWRVLHPGGRLAISDVYARNPEGLSALRTLPVSCGLRDAMTQDELATRLQAHGFEIFAWEDHSETLKYLAAQMILAHGSMSEFWSKSEPQADPFDVQIAISKAKLGYYAMVARKV
jgi:arsenite methyltransferase